MATVIFYEKPGCINNTKQKKLLSISGHNLDIRNLLEEAWSEKKLRPYFIGLAVEEWFNRSAPAVKTGVVDPDAVSEQEALALMIDMPLLIRRPLMQVKDEYRIGFDVNEVNAWIGLEAVDMDIDLETCTLR